MYKIKKKKKNCKIVDLLCQTLSDYTEIIIYTLKDRQENWDIPSGNDGHDVNFLITLKTFGKHLEIGRFKRQLDFYLQANELLMLPFPLSYI